MIRLHHVAQARSFRILWLLHELGERFEIVHHSMFDKSLRQPDYLAMSPAGRVPALEIDGRVMFESGAITQYLCETRGRLSPRFGDADWPDWLEWLHFAETLSVHVANLTQHHIVLRDPSMASPTVMKLEAARLAKTLHAVDRALAGRDWLLASGFSSAETQLGYSARMARHFVRLDGMENLRAWIERIESRPAFRSALAEDGKAELYTREFYDAPAM